MLLCVTKGPFAAFASLLLLPLVVALAGCDRVARQPVGARHRRVDAYLSAEPPAAKSGSSTPTAGSTSKAWTATTVEVRAERIARGATERRRASCCRAS